MTFKGTPTSLASAGSGQMAQATVVLATTDGIRYSANGGTSWHAALVGEYLIERLAHVPVEVEYASEFRYRNAPLDDKTLVFVMSQSGETADTLAAMRDPID